MCRTRCTPTNDRRQPLRFALPGVVALADTDSKVPRGKQDLRLGLGPHQVVSAHAGRVLATGTPDEVRASSDPVVRRFLDRLPEPEDEHEDRFREMIVGSEAGVG